MEYDLQLGPQGIFLSLEGVDGSGKSTQAARLADSLREEGFTVELLREPGGTALGEKLREVLLSRSEIRIGTSAELLLFNAARAQLLEERIVPALKAGHVVILDRFCDSTFAYQGYGRRLPEGYLDALETWVVGEWQPARTWLLDVPPEVSRARREVRGETADRFEAEAESFRARVREGYLERARRFPARVKVLDGSLGPNEVFSSIRDDLAVFLGAPPPGRGIV
ncbi:MAG: thymidylate kinase [Fibrobacterota bacterium]|jgi:dTMP kinase